jgi:LmbE family N-acetylglucosaminyl deacetylase
VVAPHPGDDLLGVGGLLGLLAEGGSEVLVVAVTDGPSPRPDAHQRALAGVGIATVVERLNLPDGAVAAHSYELSGALAELLRDDDWCLATWSGDGAPDHEATGRAAGAGCRVAGARLLEFPLLTWTWATPDDPRVPWDRARRVELGPELRERKARAVDAYRSHHQPPPVPPTADAEVLFV